MNQIRGAVCGHWLNAVALLLAALEDTVQRQRAGFIVADIGRCQQENGGEWCLPIPEKYLYWLKRGENTWAPAAPGWVRPVFHK